MNVEEFSNEFDVLLNSQSFIKSLGIINSIGSIEVDEYEKSVFLTKAQEEIVLSLYTGLNQFNESFEETEKLRRYLSNLVQTYSTSTKYNDNYIGISKNYSIFALPKDVWFITYEAIIPNDPNLGCLGNKHVEVIPVTQDEYHRIKNNPFKGPTKKRALRLDLEDNMVEIVYDYTINKYLIRYLVKPQPIILTTLPDNLSIDGKNTISECELNSAIHRTILNRAVEIAIEKKYIRTNNN